MDKAYNYENLPEYDTSRTTAHQPVLQITLEEFEEAPGVPYVYWGFDIAYYGINWAGKAGVVWLTVTEYDTRVGRATLFENEGEIAVDGYSIRVTMRGNGNSYDHANYDYAAWTEYALSEFKFEDWLPDTHRTYLFSKASDIPALGWRAGIPLDVDQTKARRYRAIMNAVTSKVTPAHNQLAMTQAQVDGELDYRVYHVKQECARIADNLVRRTPTSQTMAAQWNKATATMSALQARFPIPTFVSSIVPYGTVAGLTAKNYATIIIMIMLWLVTACATYVWIFGLMYGAALICLILLVLVLWVWYIVTPTRLLAAGMMFLLLYLYFFTDVINVWLAKLAKKLLSREWLHRLGAAPSLGVTGAAVHLRKNCYMGQDGATRLVKDAGVGAVKLMGRATELVKIGRVYVQCACRLAIAASKAHWT